MPKSAQSRQNNYQIKTMKVFLKCAIAALFISGTFSEINAQKATVGVNLMTGLPMGDWADGNGFGLGGGIDFDYYLTDMFAIGIEAGYVSFSSDFDDVATTMIPIMAKATYFFGEDEIRPYLGLGLGYYLADLTFDGESLEIYEGGLGFSPRAGLQYSLTDALSLNFNVQYNMVLNEVNESVTANGATVTTEAPATNYLGFNLGLNYDFLD